jgi:hypothetical protein
MEDSMNKLLLAASVMAGMYCISDSTTTFAQSSTTKLQQTTISKNIQTSVIRSIGAQENTVEIATSPKIFTVTRVNSNMNTATHEGRNSEAKEIASNVAAGILDQLEFKEVITIRVEYLARSALADESKTVDSVEFRKGPDGVFDFHQS